MKRFFTLLISLLLLNSNSFATLNTPSLVSPAQGSTNNEPNVLVDWSAVTGATGYEFRMNTDPSLSGAGTNTVTTSQITSVDLLFGTTYYWQVRAVKSTAPQDSSSWTGIYSFTTLNQLTHVSPSNGAAFQEPNVLLDWNPVSGILAYDYEWDTTAAFNSPLYTYGSISGISQVNTSNLRFGTLYYWRVRARHATDTTAWSNAWTFTTLDQVYLVSPSNGAAFQEPNVLLDWSPISGILAYDYEWDTTASFSSSQYSYGSVSGSSQINTANLRFGTTYYWRVRVRHTADTSAWSNAWTFTTLDQVYLVSPSNGAAFQEPNVLLDWSPISGILAYDYEWDTTASFNSSQYSYGSVSGSSQINTANLRFGTTYYWRVRVRHTADTSAWSNAWTFTTLDQVYLVSPSNGAAFQEPNVLLDWSPISGILAYDYEWDTTASFNSSQYSYGSVSGSSQINTANLRFGTTYYWRARVRHATDTSGWSNTWTFTTLDQLSLVSPSNGATFVAPNVLLDWNFVSGILAYDYELDTVAAFNSSANTYSSISGTSQVNTANLYFGATYYWRVRVRHAADTSQWSNAWTFTVQEKLSHVSPANNAVSIGLNPTIDWNFMSGINGYEYRYSTDSTFSTATQLSSGTTSQAGLVNLSYGTTYYWQVRAYHSADTTAWSNFWSFTTIYQLSTPTLISPANASINVPVTGANFSWNAVGSAAGYEIQYALNNAFSNAITLSSTNTSSVSGTLLSDTTYFWRVRAVNGSGNSAWSTIWSFKTEISTGINQTEVDAVTLYPNPAADYIIIKSNHSAATYSLFTVTGIEVQSGLLKPGPNTVSITQLKSGAYVFYTQQRSIRFVKE